MESVTKQYLKKCTYHKVTDSLCPVFDLGYVVKESGQNFTVLAVKVLDVWRCALGHGGRPSCHCCNEGWDFPGACTAAAELNLVNMMNLLGCGLFWFSD